VENREKEWKCEIAGKDENADSERMAEQTASIGTVLKSWGRELQNEYRVDWVEMAG